MEQLPQSEEGATVERIRQIFTAKPEAFGEIWERLPDFIAQVKAVVAEECPEHADIDFVHIPEFQRLIGSTMPQDADRNFPPELVSVVRSEINALLDEIEEKNN